MAEYITRQRKAMLDFFEKHTDEQFTAAQIAASPECGGISVSTVYRNLADMEAEGKVVKLTRAGSREVYYRFAAAHECHGKLHLSCRSCGRTCHVDPETAEKLMDALKRNEHFTLDKDETVLYGTCKKCMLTRRLK